MKFISAKKVGSAALFPLLVAELCAWVLAPAIAIIWLLKNGAWSDAGWCALSSLFAGFLACLTLFFGGFFGGLGMLLIPVVVAAYAQYDFLSFASRSLGAEHQVQFAMYSLLVAVLPVINLGRGEDSEPGVISWRGLFAITAAAAAWLYYRGTFNAYWQFALLYLTGSILGFVIAACIAKSAEGASNS